MKILVTGCAGMLGSVFSTWILDNHPSIEIVGVDNLCTGFRENVDDRLIFYQIDLVDHDAVESIFQQHKFHYICHFAAFACEAISDFVRRFTFTQNVIASTNLINCAINHDVKRFLFTSSIASYGDITPPFKESDHQVPKDIYGLTKHITEEDLRIAHEHHGLDYVIIRPFNCLGPKQSLSSIYRNVAGIFISKLIDNKPLTIYGDGQQMRSFSYLPDMLPAMWNAMTLDKARNQTYNLGASKMYTVKELADMLIDITGKGSIEYLEERHEVKIAGCDVTKAKKDLHYEEKTDLRTGLTSMWLWAQSAERHPTKKIENIEIQKGLYSFWR